jgi:hypothetical protein
LQKAYIFSFYVFQGKKNRRVGGRAVEIINIITPQEWGIATLLQYCSHGRLLVSKFFGIINQNNSPSNFSFGIRSNRSSERMIA